MSEFDEDRRISVRASDWQSGADRIKELESELAKRGGYSDEFVGNLLRQRDRLEAEISRMRPYVDFAVSREAKWEFRVAELEAELQKLEALFDPDKFNPAIEWAQKKEGESVVDRVIRVWNHMAQEW
jgi:hypothetical protein